MGNKGEVIHVGLLGSAIEDSDFGIGHTSAKSTLDVGLILLKSRATSRSWKWREILSKKGNAIQKHFNTQQQYMHSLFSILTSSHD